MFGPSRRKFGWQESGVNSKARIDANLRDTCDLGLHTVVCLLQVSSWAVLVENLLLVSPSSVRFG